MVAVLHTLRSVRPAWLGPAVVAGAGLGACVVLALDDRHGWGIVPPCPFRFATGLDCPGCGTVRALRALAGGDILRAVEHNVLTVAMLPVLVAAFVMWAWRAVVHADARLPQLPAQAAWALTGVVIGFAVLRNLPWLPFAWLGSGAG